jgi:hypothetical protein
MSGEERELSSVEEALAALRPAACGLDRDRLMWEAGRASRRTPVAWPLAAAAAALVAVALAVRPGEPPQPQAVERLVYVTAGPAPPTPAPFLRPAATGIVAVRQPPHAGYLELRRAVLARGLDGLPETAHGSATGAESIGDLLREYAG